MTSNKIVFTGRTMTNLEEARKLVRTLQVTIPLYHIEDPGMMKGETIIKKIQWFKSNLKQIRTITTVEVVLTDEEVRFVCNIFLHHEQTTVSFEEIETLFDELQLNVAVVVHSWDIFDYWTDLIVHVSSPQTSVN